MRRGLAAAAVLLAATSAHAAGRRVIAVGGPITEIVYRLGAEKELVGVDSSSIFPKTAQALPQVGYQRALSAESVLALKPDLILAGADAGPPAVLQQLEAAHVKIVRIAPCTATACVRDKIVAVAAALDRKAEGDKLAAEVNRSVKDALATPGPATAPKVLFVYARGSKTLMVSGKGSAAHAMIVAAGGRNAIDAFDGFRPLTAEAVVGAAPDVIVIPEEGLASLGGESGLYGLPGVALTPAAKLKRVVAIDNLALLGFGPRVAEALVKLRGELRKVASPGGDAKK